MANKNDVAKLAQKIVDHQNAAEEYRQAILDIETEGVFASPKDREKLPMYKEQRSALMSTLVGLWEAAEVLGKSEEVTAKVIELKEGFVLKLTNTSVLQHISRK